MAYIVARYQPTPNDPQAQQSFMVLCSQSWKTFGERGHSPWSVDCNNFKAGTSDIVDSMAAVILHEWLHWDNVFAPMASPIRDWNHDGPMVVIPPIDYGPYNAHILKLSGRVPTANVENHIWLAGETFF
jgi:hypothetical protein